jgi:cellulose biosynthesis protein BcsQ
LRPITKPVAFIRHEGRDDRPGPVAIIGLSKPLARGFAIIAATDALDRLERLPIEAARAFGERLRELTVHFDLVVIDTPPTLGFGTLAPLHGSDFASAPLTPDGDSASGVHFEKVQQVQSGANKDLCFIGLQLNRVNTRHPTRSGWRAMKWLTQCRI